MPRKKPHRISRPVRKAAKAFTRFADRLSALIAAEVRTALGAAVAEAERAEAAVEEASPVVKVAPQKKVRRRRRVVAVEPATAPRAPRKRGRPPKVNLLASREPSGAPVDILPGQVADASEVELKVPPPLVTVKVIPPRRRRRHQSRLLPDQVRAASAPQVILRPGRLGKVESVDAPVSVTPPEIAGEAAVTAGRATQVKEPEVVPEEVVAADEEPAMPTPTKPPDRLTRMRTAFRLKKIAHVADDAAVPAPEGEGHPGE